MHVLIAGAGLGGPALALSLARHGIRSTIYEIRPRPSNAGGSITLASSAIRVLDNPVGVYGTLREVGYTYTRMGAHSDDGYKFGDVMVGETKGGDYPAIRILRTDLQKVLLDACDSQNGLVEIKWNAVVEEIRESEQGVAVTFADDTSVQGDVLIGCDGIHSKTRQHLLADISPRANFAGQCTVNGFLPSSKINLPEGCSLPFVVFTANGLVMAVPIDKEGQTVAWGITADTKERDREGWKEYEVSGQAAREAKGLFADVNTEPIRSVLDNAIESEARVWPHHSIGDIPTWHKGRICLLGDAAHAMPPNGQGTALAFEDAAYLSRLLTTTEAVNKGYDRLFAQFETARRARVADIARSAKPSSTIKSHVSPWIWCLKKWAFWAFFWWHGREVRMGHDQSYDVMKESIEVL